MVFSSHLFLFYFLPAVLAAYYLTPKRARTAFLTLASYVFYGWWNPWFVLLMLGSTWVDYQCGKAVTADGASDRQRRAAVTVSVVVNLSLLGFFKYWMFFADNANTLLTSLGTIGHIPTWQIVLPVGISFYTFQSMSYTIDLYRGQARRAASFFDFAAYVSLFPQLVAGPIIRYRDLADQLPERHQDMTGMARGLAYFSMGLAKKVLLANNLAPIADTAFAADAASWHVAWIGVIAYAFQIYFDFSGYSDMAIGLGQMLGFRFPQNFRSPYHATSITDFWRRWHISLSSWLRDYLYIPLGGNRKGPRRTYINLAITMLLGGLWHGAQWQFIVWGGLHGSLLALERGLGSRLSMPRLPKLAKQALTFGLVLITWVFFRAASLGEAMAFLGSMFGLSTSHAAATLVAGRLYNPAHLLVLLLAAGVVWGCPRTESWIDGGPKSSGPKDRSSRDVSGQGSAGRGLRSPRRLTAVFCLFVFALLELSVQGHNPFLYFQF